LYRGSSVLSADANWSIVCGPNGVSISWNIEGIELPVVAVEVAAELVCPSVCRRMDVLGPNVNVVGVQQVPHAALFGHHL
jgi:hypothetical protein